MRLAIATAASGCPVAAVSLEAWVFELRLVEGESMIRGVGAHDDR